MAAFDAAAQKSAKADATVVAAHKQHAKAAALVADADRVLNGEATKTTKLLADQGNKAETAASQISNLAGSGGGLGGAGIAGLIVAAAGLSPVLVTLG